MVTVPSEPAPLPPVGCWCGHGELRAVFRTRRFGLVRCTACGCFRIDPPPIAGDEEGARFYTDYYAKGQPSEPVAAVERPESARRDSRFWRVVEQVPDLGRPQEKVVDIGCGEGGLCAELKAAGWPSVAGFDLSRTRVARARKRMPDIEFHDCAFSDGGIADSSLDLVIMDNVVEHLSDPRSTIRSVAQALKAEGLLVLITPNMRSGQFRLLGRRWTVELSPHTHIFLFTPDALSQLLSLCGFVVKESGSFHLAPYPVREMMRQWWRGEYKEAAWHAMNEVGARHARLIGSGPMLYAVARRASR